LVSILDNFVNNKHKYENSGIPHKLGFLLHGKPGNGKSSLAFAIAKTYDKNIYKINLTVDKTSFMNQIIEISQGSVVVIEDIDTCTLSHDRSNVDAPKTDETKSKTPDKLSLGDILEVLDGYCFLQNCIIIMTTNFIDRLDSALIRSGRMDHKIQLENVSKEQITQIISYFYKKDIDIKLIKDIDISVSELINTTIIPNLNNYNKVLNYLTNLKND
jgi:chaperone BCS1